LLRVGTVPFLVARPLIEGLGTEKGVALTVAPPAELVMLLRAGRLDLALASSILSIEQPAHRLWEEGPLIACRGPIRSVLLFLRPGLEDPSSVQTLVCDPASRTGRALACILLSQKWQANYREKAAGPDADPFSQGVDAVQLIGDAALLAVGKHPDWCFLDLGEAWTRWNRLPFVFAGWIGRRGFDPAAAKTILLAAAGRGLARRDSLAAEGIGTLGLETGFLRRYLMEDLSYGLPVPEVRASMEAFRKQLSQVSLALPPGGMPDRATIRPGLGQA